MISDLFFYGKLKDVENILIYEEEFVLFYLKTQLQNFSSFSKEKVEELLENLYGRENIKSNKILKFCDQHFNSKNKDYILEISEEEKDFYKNTQDYAHTIMPLKTVEKNNLYDVLEKEIADPQISFPNKLRKCITYYNWSSELTPDKKMIMFYKYFNILKNYYKMYRIIDSKLEKIPELFNVLEITELNLKEEQLHLLIYNNVFTLKNLKHMPIDSLICIFSNDIESFIKKIRKYSINKKDIISHLNSEFNNIIKPEWDVVLKKRFDIQTNQKRSLREVGNELRLSRERIRQIEINIIKKLLVHNEEINTILYCVYKDINKENKDFITIEEFSKYVNNEQVIRYLVVILISNGINMTLNEKYGIIYNTKEITLEEILKEAESKLKDIILIADIKKYDKVQKIIIEDNYKDYQGKILVRKGTNISSIYMNEIKENFVDGYNIGSKDDYDKLIEIITEKYGEIEIPSMHSIQCMIDRLDFIQIDRGTYKAIEYAATIPEELVEQIINFIVNNSPLVSYNLIFEKFKDKLGKIGIDNRFYLKGILDRKLPKEFNTGRDFINTNSEKDITTYDIMRDTFKSFEGEFSIEDISEKRPGLKEYNYENYAKAEEENGLIRIATKTYIYIEKLSITKQVQDELKMYIDNLFEKMDSKILTVKKIYASLSIMNKELFNKLQTTAKFGDDGLFYIIKYLFKEQYYYSRPLISLEENFATSTYLLVKEYVRRLEQFNYSDTKSYIYKMNLSGNYNYMNLMEDLSDEYVQINKDSMIRIEKMEISQENLEKIKEFIDLLLRRREVKTDDFDGYFMLPKLNRPWNKYLLIGIIRTYFKNEYEIENTTNSYDTTEFIVRRSN